MPKVGSKKFPYTAKGKSDAAESKRQAAMKPKSRPAKKEPTAAQQLALHRQKKASQAAGLRKYTDRDETNVKRTIFNAQERAKARMKNKKKY